MSLLLLFNPQGAPPPAMVFVPWIGEFFCYDLEPPRIGLGRVGGGRGFDRYP